MLLGITHGNFFENMLRLMHFGVYFERILKIKLLFSYRNNYSIVTLNEKWLFSYRNNDISCTHARGHAPQRENLEKISDLVRLGVYFDQILH